MIFWEKWKAMKGCEGVEPAWPDPLWYLEVIIVDPTLNDDSVKPYTLYENKAYPQFYVADEPGQRTIMEKIKDCYKRHEGNIEAFMEEAYEIVLCTYMNGKNGNG